MSGSGTPRVPERRRREGICYAATRDGIELPVIDVTHPAFVVRDDPAEIAAREEAFVRDERRREAMPRFLVRALAHLALRRSVIAGGMARARQAPLDGMTTYLMKLGPEMLGDGYATVADRRIAASLPGCSARLRLLDMARLLADALAPSLARSPEVPLRLINIGGGPSADSLNALILLRRNHPGLLAQRRIEVVVLDQDVDGPAFGTRALEALRTGGGPLEGVHASCRHAAYDWSEPGALAGILGRAEGVVAASSEGGLFDYGSDTVITGNLAALRSAVPDLVVLAGTVTRAEGPVAYLKRYNDIPTHPRTIEAFGALAGRAGWNVARAIPRPFSHDVALIPIPPQG